MLKRTFVHIPGIGKETESFLLNHISDWHDYIANHRNIPISEQKKQLINYHIKKSISSLKKGYYNFFINNIPTNLHWRAYNELKNKCCFLDIETTGLDRRNDDITLIGLYNGKESKFFVNGKNMNKFEKEIKKYPLIVTFNGRCFDVPFIQAKFPKINFNKFHIDLRFAMKEIGYAGGLKRIEKEIGIQRSPDLEEVDGFEAVRLWYRYKKGNEDALKLLIKYNKADIENLKTIMEFAFDKLKQKETISPSSSSQFS